MLFHHFAQLPKFFIQKYIRNSPCFANLQQITASQFEHTITTTGLAGGLLRPYKGLLPALESKDSSK